ncbi:MAG: class I SAM-dependent methyltransferase [Stellaceae bacterium]
MPDQTTANLAAARAPLPLADPRGSGRAARIKDLTDPWSRALLRSLRRLQHGHLSLRTPAGATLSFGAAGTAPAVKLAIRDARVARRLIFNGSIGFAEAYMDGAWDCPDLVGLVMLAIANEHALGLDRDGSLLIRAIERVRHALHRNSRRGSARNIAHHYDLGNEFYAAWLDPSMTYSAGLFGDGADDLETAQQRKYQAVAELLELAPGQEVLEIGCGWGGFAEFAAAGYGSRVTALTLSQQQRDYAARRIDRRGFSDRAAIRIQDYRDAAGAYDRIASIEMIEAVGAENWATYFDRIRAFLKPQGIAVLQAITIADERFESYRRCPDFIQRYIFPGGMLPSHAALQKAVAAAGLRLGSGPRFAASYARTLALWQQRFQAAWPTIAALGFDRRFKRMWEYYLAYCEAGFRAGTLDVGLYRIERQG